MIPNSPFGPDVILWTESGGAISLKERFNVHNAIRSWCLSPDGEFVAFASNESVHLWNTKDLSGPTEWKRADSNNHPTCLRFNPSGSRLLEGTQRGGILIYDLKGDPLLQLPISITAETLPLGARGAVADLSFNIERNSLIVAYDNGTVLEWVGSSDRLTRK